MFLTIQVLTKGRIALENQDEPTITVITIVRNNSLGLRKTIESVSSQSWHKLEYLVIDGTPTGEKQDENLKLLSINYSSSIDFWLSCLDKGIYDCDESRSSFGEGKVFTFYECRGSILFANILLKEFASFWNPQIDILVWHRLLHRLFKQKPKKADPSKVNPILSYMDLLYAMVSLPSKSFDSYRFTEKISIYTRSNHFRLWLCSPMLSRGI